MDKKRKRQLLQNREDFIAQLYQDCLSTKEITKWAQFEPIWNKLQKVIEIEQELLKVNPSCNREEHLNDFLNWLHTNHVDTSNFEVSSFNNYGMGLKATKDLPSDQCFLMVPLSIIITSETVLNSPSLGPLISNDPLLRSMPNVALALYVLHERFQTQWKPYFDVLPTHFETPMYLTLEQLNRLKPSAALSDALNHIQCIARQYCYIHNLLKGQMSMSKLAENFSYDTYRWAVSVVSTRQNNILNKNGNPQLSLIPLMDFLNHQYGRECIHFDRNRERVECQTMNDVKKDEQIFMFYGKRTNAQYLIHNGFVPKQSNPYDNYLLRLTLSKADKAFYEKNQLLKRYGMDESDKFLLFVDDELLNPTLFIFIKIFLMNPDEINQVLSKNTTMEEFFDHFTIDKDPDVRNFLTTRLQIHIRALNRTTLQQDDAIDTLLISEYDLLTKAFEKLQQSL